MPEFKFGKVQSKYASHYEHNGKTYIASPDILETFPLQAKLALVNHRRYLKVGTEPITLPRSDLNHLSGRDVFV